MPFECTLFVPVTRNCAWRVAASGHVLSATRLRFFVALSYRSTVLTVDHADQAPPAWVRTFTRTLPFAGPFCVRTESARPVNV